MEPLEVPPGTVIDGRVFISLLRQAGRIEVAAGAAEVTDALADDAEDLFHGDPTIAPVRIDPSVDTRYWGAGRLLQDPAASTGIPGSDDIFACDRSDVTSGPLVVCGSDRPDPGSHLAIWNCVAAPVPLVDPQFVSTFWVMFDDGDPTTGFQALPQFANDVLGGTDVHYWLESDGAIWSVRRTEGARLTTTPTSAWASIDGECVTFFVPEGEIAITDSTRVGVAGFSGPIGNPFGLQATSDRAPGPQTPLLALADALQWTFPYAVLAGEAARLEPPPIAVESADGLARLFVPLAALPEGVSAEDLRITRLSSDELPLQADEGPMIGFRLEPEGVQLAEPVRFEIEFEADGPVVPVLWHVAGEELRLVEDVEVRYDAETGRATVLGQVMHFSFITIDTKGFFEATITPQPTSLLLGESVTVTGRVRRIRSTFSYRTTAAFTGTLVDVKVQIRGPWTLKGGFIAGPTFSGALSPNEIENAPSPFTRVSGAQSSAQGTFTCWSPHDRAEIGYLADLQYKVYAEAQETGYFGSSIIGRAGRWLIPVSAHVRAFVEEFECKPAFPGQTFYTDQLSDVFVNPIKATLIAPDTYYTVEAEARDPNLEITYEWKRSEGACGAFSSFKNVAVWHHPHNEATGCGATVSHPGTVTVTVRTAGGDAVQRTYEGTVGNTDQPPVSPR